MTKYKCSIIQTEQNTTPKYKQNKIQTWGNAKNTKYIHHKIQMAKIQMDRNTNGSKYKWIEIKMDWNTNRTKCKLPKYKHKDNIQLAEIQT